MAHTAYLPIIADRYGAVVRHIFVAGLDLTGIDMRAQVRLYGDVPGAPLVDLTTVTNGNAQGLRLVKVTSDGIGIPTSHVELVINESTMGSLPYAGEIGDVTTLAWDWQVTIAGRKRRLAKGEFQITGDGVTGAESAPTNRIAPFGLPQRPVADVWSSARMTFGEEQVTVQIDGADLVAPLAKKASDAASSAEADRTGAELAAATALAASRYFPSKAAGEAGSVVDQAFSTNDAGVLVSYRRTAGGSVEIARSLTPASMAAADGAGRVGFNQGSAFVQTRMALDKLREIGASVRDTAAKGNFDADDTDALQEIINHFGTRGGRFYFPPGLFRTTRPLVVGLGVREQAIFGQGQRGVYPSQINPNTYQGDLAVIVPTHTERAAITFSGQTGDSSVTFRDLAIATMTDGPRPQACFGWDTTDLQFLRNFRIFGVSINDFVSAFDTYQTSGDMKQVGLLWVRDCNIHRNEHIARSLDDTQWNGFSFCFNEAGQNGYNVGHGGIDISGHNVTILGNCLEGMRDPIKVRGAYRGIYIHANYLEACVGKALINLQGARTYDIGTQAELALDFANLDHAVLLANCGKGTSAVPYRPFGVHKMPPQINGNDARLGDNVNNPSTGTAVEGWWRCDSLDGAGYGREPEATTISRARSPISAREANPLGSGGPLPVAEHISSGAGAISDERTLTGASGDWCVISWLFKRGLHTGDADQPYLSIDVNGDSSPAPMDYPISEWNTWWRAGEWCLLTAAVKLTAPMSSVRLTFFPFGVNPPAGRVTRYLRPIVYTTNSPDKIVPFIDQDFAQTVTVAPAAGQWRTGDQLKSASPSSGATRFVCTADGAPGTWISA